MPIDDLVSDVSFQDLDGLTQNEAAIVSFVEDHLVDRHGLLMAHLNAETLRPWTVEQFEEKDLVANFYNKARGDIVGQLTYEDSLMATGEYAQSRLLKYEATGDANALAEAAQPIFALLRVLEEGAKYEPGFLPKPHGGMLRAGHSHELSVDQYIKAITALRLWQKHCGAAMSKQIDAHFIAMADYHFNRNFIHPRRESFVVTPENRTHGMAFFIPILVLAYRISGDKKYKRALDRFDPILDELVAAEELPTNCNLVSLFTEGFDMALTEGHTDERLTTILARMWEQRLRDCGIYGLYNDNPGDYHASSRALRIAAFAPIVDRYVPGAEAWKLGIHLLKNMTDPAQMLYANCSPDKLRPTARFHAYSICETSISSWLVGYWGLVLEGRQA